MLRGRETVRADRRLRTDDKPVRAQSTIVYKIKPKPRLLLSITVFSIRMRFSSVWKTRLARAARKSVRDMQWYFKKPYTAVSLHPAPETESLVAEYHAIRRDLLKLETGNHVLTFP